MSGAKDDKKPAADSSAQINIKVKDQNDEKEVFFMIKRNTKLKKLMDAYCELKSVDNNAIVFLFDGQRIRGDQSPDDYWKWRTVNRLRGLRGDLQFMIQKLPVAARSLEGYR
ncbi:Small ubiquitin-related modifier 1 [Castilleja foliolosa]|uniref:Small ubiquitin-related modifier 1 n=1 Tax=Castilleja foliolosa TaxID=1961234 RepID=A0ABD3CRU4_9LAMI